MTKIRAGRPHSASRLVRFLDNRIRDLKGHKTQAEIAAEAGFLQSNMLAMIKKGATKLPLERVPALAKALQCDPANLFVMAVEQRDSALASTLEEIYGSHVTQNEVVWLKAIRDASDNSDPTLTTKALRTIRGIFGK